ncbi:unnamed protein product [Oikopleura dioica]|uniref:Uncharacterized protein n=1 Tax=Oikopleura dioica TaxID=34765 RepID=E4YAH7_OIKDI|nr:unnamed protein product [Oikopleura dioica]
MDRLSVKQVTGLSTGCMTGQVADPSLKLNSSFVEEFQIFNDSSHFFFNTGVPSTEFNPERDGFSWCNGQPIDPFAFFLFNEKIFFGGWNNRKRALCVEKKHVHMTETFFNPSRIYK